MALKLILAQVIFGSAVGDPAVPCSGLACEVDAMKVELLQKKTEVKPHKAAALVPLHGPTNERVEDGRPTGLQLGAVGELGEEHVDAAGLASFRAYLDEHFTFDNQSAKDSFTKKHASSWLKSRRNETKESISLASTEETYCPLAYSNTFFDPRVNLCKDSFTGLSSCTLDGCAALTTIWYGPVSFLGAPVCYKIFYSNAGTGYGMCRCWQLGTNVNLKASSSGNNIYSCSPNWP